MISKLTPVYLISSPRKRYIQPVAEYTLSVSAFAVHELRLPSHLRWRTSLYSDAPCQRVQKFVDRGYASRFQLPPLCALLNAFSLPRIFHFRSIYCRQHHIFNLPPTTIPYRTLIPPHLHPATRVSLYLHPTPYFCCLSPHTPALITAALRCRHLRTT